MGYGFPSDSNIFAGPLGIGGGGGGESTQCKTSDGLLVKKLGVWHNKSGLIAVRVTYTDGTEAPAVGTSRDSYDEITLAPEEVISRVSQWGDGRGKQAGHIMLVTNKGQHSDIGKEVKGQTEYPIEIGSGILAGICGRSGYAIDMLALIFLRPFESLRISEMKFGDLPVGPGAPQTKQSQVVDFLPNPTKEINWTFTNSLQKTNSKQVSSTTTMTWGTKVTVKTTVEASIRFIAKVEVDVSVEGSWSIATAKMISTTETEQITLSWGLSGKLQPGDEPIHCVASAIFGEAVFPYTGKSTITFANPPGSLMFTETGTYKVSQWMQAFATAQNSKGPVDAQPINSGDQNADGSWNPKTANKALPAPGPGDSKALLAATPPGPPKDGAKAAPESRSLEAPESEDQPAQSDAPDRGLKQR